MKDERILMFKTKNGKATVKASDIVSVNDVSWSDCDSNSMIEKSNGNKTWVMNSFKDVMEAWTDNDMDVVKVKELPNLTEFEINQINQGLVRMNRADEELVQELFGVLVENHSSLSTRNRFM